MYNIILHIRQFSTGSPRLPIGTGKPGKWEGIFQPEKSQGILSRLEKSGNSKGN